MEAVELPLHEPGARVQALWEFPKLGGYLIWGVLIIRILLFRVLS